MPVIKRRGGWSWGRSGTVVPTKSKAQQIGRAIQMAKMKKKKKGGRRG